MITSGFPDSMIFLRATIPSGLMNPNSMCTLGNAEVSLKVRSAFYSPLNYALFLWADGAQ